MAESDLIMQPSALIEQFLHYLSSCFRLRQRTGADLLANVAVVH